MKKVIKENKVLFVLALIILVSLILIVVGTLSYFYSDGGDKYGNRLDGIENFKISKTIDSDIKSLFESGVESVSVDIKGKIIYIIIDVSAGISKTDAQSIAIKSLEKFTEEEKGFYDIHFTVTCKNATEETTMYPMMGSKHSGNPQVVWTNN
jgi:hypothetical protein